MTAVLFIIAVPILFGINSYCWYRYGHSSGYRKAWEDMYDEINKQRINDLEDEIQEMFDDEDNFS